MKEWKQALEITKLEWKASANTVLLYSIFNIIFLIIIFTQLPILDGGTTIVGDILFTLTFLLFPTYMKSKDLRMQKISGELWAAPSVVMLQQLPILRNAIVKSRFIIYFFSSFPFQVVFLICLYATTPEIRGMNFDSYIAFAIIWLSIGIYIGYVMPVSDGGGIINWKTMTGSSLYLALLGIAVFFLFHGILDIGIVEWTIMIAKNYPLLSICTSILLAFLGFLYNHRYLKRTIKKLDYL